MMNEVKATQVSPVTPELTAPRNASSPGAENANDLPSTGKELPLDNKTEMNATTQGGIEAASKLTPTSDVEEAVTEINEYVQSVQRDLHFSVDEDSGLTVIRVRDKESGDLIRQIPEDIFLNMAQKLKENQSLHLFDAHG